MWPSKRR
jgi:Flp pilus assembly protein TadB